MELTGALEAARAPCRSQAWHPSTSHPTVPCRSYAPSHYSRVFLKRNGGSFRNNGAVLRSSSASPFLATDGAFLPRRGSLSRPRGKSAEVEVEVVDEEVPKSEVPKSGAEGEQNEVTKSDEEEFGIDADGNLTASLPLEFLELMKDEGPPPNYWFAAFGLTVAFLARKSIWKEVKFWGKLVLGSVHLAWDAVGLLFNQLIVWGGDPLAKVIVAVAYVGLTINNVFRFIAEVIPPLPVLFAVTLASIVLLVGERVSDTYNSSEKEFPSRRILDTAGLLGLGGFVGVIPVEITLLGIAAITIFLLFVRKVNPVAGFTPAAAVFAAIAEPVIRYPVLLSFVGAATYRYWRLGYMSSGAVQKERTGQYPRILIVLLYFVGIALAARTFFFIVDFIRVAILTASAVSAGLVAPAASAGSAGVAASA